MKRNIYKFLLRSKHAMFLLVLVGLLDTAKAQVTYSLNYTGSFQTLTLQAGSYSIECWGANGGAGGTTSALTGTGGIGGYSSGVYAITSPTVLYIYVGGVGQSTNITGGSMVTAAGGWNGGGGGRSGASNSYFRGGGGGGTDVRTTQNTTYANRIIVAGGGGGAGGSSGTPATWVGSGGNGGGLSGQDGVLAGSQSNHNGKGGTQTAGGAGGVNSGNIGVAGSFGLGGDGGGTSNAFPAGGGGGGWYGGGGGATQGGGGGGGSSYVGGVTSGTTMMFGQPSFVPNPASGGNGMVIITELCGISLAANGVNSNVAICSGASVSLTTNAISNYSWSTGASTSSLVVSPTITTSYTLTALSLSNCVTSAVITITVDPSLPILAVSNTANSGGICPTRTVALTATGANNYTWTGVGPVTNGVPFTPSVSGGYTVAGVNACGTSTAATSVSIHPLPNVTAVAGQPSVCSGNPVSLTGVGNATNYVWSNNVANGGNIFPGTTANYTVVGTSALGCTAQAIVGVTVVTTPQNPLIPNPPLICIGNSVTLSSSGATNYTWTGPNGTYNTASFLDTPTITSTYTLTKSNANCVNTQTVNVIVNNLPPVSAIVNPTIVCASRPGTLNAAGASNFTWTSGPPTWSATGAQVVVSPSVSTLYTVTASDGTCVNTTTIFLATNPNPTITIVPSSTAICFGQTATLTASGAIGYNWTNTTIVTNPTLSTIVESPTISTLYSVVGENSFSCTTVANQVIVVHPNPTLTISSNKPMVCEGAAANLTVTGANTYQWDANAGNATSNIVQVNPLTSTIYTVAGTFTSTQCSSTKTILTTVFLPTFAVNNPTSSCLGGTINLIASGATSYTWNGTQPFSQIAVSPPTETVYVVAATSISLGVTCISTRTVLVSIYNNPTVTAVAERTMICRGETTDLTAAGAQTYTWNTNQSGDIVPVGPFNNTTYTVTGIDQNGCIGTTTVSVRVSTCFGIDEQGFNLSNPLTVFPNPNNGSFVIKGLRSTSYMIINELGQTIRIGDTIKHNNDEVIVEDLEAGIYFVISEDKKEKIVVTK